MQMAILEHFTAQKGKATQFLFNSLCLTDKKSENN